MNSKVAIQLLEHFKKDYKKPLLIYHWQTIDKNIKTLKNALGRYGVEIVFPVKAFPFTDFLIRLATLEIGFDVSRKNEFDLIRDFCSETSIVTYSGVTPIDFETAYPIIEFNNVISNANSLCSSYRININRSGLRFSHFGIANWNDLHNHCNINQIHIHLSDISRDTKEFLELFVNAIYGIKVAFPNLSVLDIGGGWDKLNFTHFIYLIKEIRKMVGDATKIIIEPGNLIFKNAGFLITRVIGINRYYNKNIIYLDSCREAHTKWSNPNLVDAYRLPNSNKSLVLCGCSCDENDIFGLYKTSFCPQIEELMIFSDITPYSGAWNSTFNGIEKAEMIIYEQ